MSMTPYELGDIVLLHVYPFSDASGGKKRPAIVLADTGDDDILVARVTSEEPRNAYDLPLKRWKEMGLLLPSSVRVAKMATLHKRLIVRKLGRVGSPERRGVRLALKRLFMM